MKNEENKEGLSSTIVSLSKLPTNKLGNIGWGWGLLLRQLEKGVNSFNMKGLQNANFEGFYLSLHYKYLCHELQDLHVFWQILIICTHQQVLYSFPISYNISRGSII